MSAVHLVRPNEGTVGPLRILARSPETRGQYFALEWETVPSAPNPQSVHTHDDFDESEYVLTGKREISCESERWLGGSGLFVMAPANTRHTMRTVDEAPSRWLHFFSPARLERFFEERERLRAAGRDDEIPALSERYGTRSAPSRSPERGPFARASDGDRRTRRIIVTGDQTRGAYALVEMGTLPDESHAHEHEEAFYVVEGELAVELDGERIEAPARSFVLVPRGVTRRHIARSSTRCIAVFSPAAIAH